jgi:hypothetical protein
MTTQTFNQRRKLTEGTAASDQWLRAGHFDPDFVAGVHADIESLRQLAANWDGYGAPRIDPAVIEAVKEFIRGLPDNLAFRPRVVPTSNGSIQLEWHDGPKSLELEFESPRLIRYLQWEPASGVEEEKSVSVKDTDTAIDLIRWFMVGACR